MRDLLMIMHAREIPACIDSLKRLPIDKVWMRGYTERQLMAVIDEIVESTHYDNYILVSDDVIANPKALRAVREALVDHPAATGYCNMAQGDPRVNLCYEPIHDHMLTLNDFPFYTEAEVKASAEPFLPTYFMGWSLTGMCREFWQEFPFRVFPERANFNPIFDGGRSDFHCSLRIQGAGVPMVGVRDAHTFHYRFTGPRQMDYHFILGKVEPAVIWEKQS